MISTNSCEHDIPEDLTPTYSNLIAILIATNKQISIDGSFVGFLWSSSHNYHRAFHITALSRITDDKSTIGVVNSYQ